MKSVMINRGVKLHAGDWDDAFCLARGMYFGLRNAVPEDEADDAIKLCNEGATPMQAAMYLYGHRGKYKRRSTGTNPNLVIGNDFRH